MALAMITRCRSPPDNWSSRRSPKLSRPTTTIRPSVVDPSPWAEASPSSAAGTKNPVLRCQDGVRLERRGGQVLATSTGSQSSGVLRSMIEAQGLLVFPREATMIREGESATVQVLDEDFFASSESGL